MMHRTRRKLAAVQIIAANLHLEGTAGRLDVLRRQLETFHNLQDDAYDLRLGWAIEKINDTQRTLEKEVDALRGSGDRDSIEDSARPLRRLCKLSIAASVFYGVFKGVESLAGSHDFLFKLTMVGGVFSIACYTLFSVVDLLLGPDSVEESMGRMSRVLEDCKGALAKHKEERGSYPGRFLP